MLKRQYALIVSIIVTVSSFLAIEGWTRVPNWYLHVRYEYWDQFNCDPPPIKDRLIHADSLEKSASKNNDVYTRCQAEFLRASYWHYNRIREKSQHHLALMRKWAKAAGNERTYFLTYYIETIYAIEDNDMTCVINTAEALGKEVTKSDLPFAQWELYNTLINVYDFLHAKKLAAQYAQLAIEAAKDVYPVVNVSINYRFLANSKKTLSETRALLYEAIQTAPSWEDSLAVYLDAAHAYFIHRDTSNYLRIYKQITCLDSTDKYHELAQDDYNTLQVEHLAFIGRQDDAFTLLEKNKSLYTENDYLKIAEDISVVGHNYQQALQFRQQRYNIKRRKNFYNIQATLRKFNLDIINTKLQQQQSHIKQQRGDLQTQKLYSDALRLQALTNLTVLNNNKKKLEIEAKIASDNYEAINIKFHHDSIKAVMERVMLKQKKAQEELARKKAKSQIAQSRLTIISCVCGIIFLVLIYMLARQAISAAFTRKKNLANRELRKAILAVNNASINKDRFIHNMSHEIRTPLNAIMGLSQILTFGELNISDDEKREYGRDIENNIRMLDMLLDDLINVSDIEKGKYTIELKDSNINEICKQAISIAQYRLPAGVNFSYDNRLPYNYHCVIDPKRAQQVLINYLTNACKHTHKGSIILQSTCDHTPGYVTFSVTDTGEGVPQEQAHNIFERFVKLKSTVQGTGIGLNICYTIAKMLNGRVWLDTTYQEGARFFFEVPTNLNPTPATPPPKIQKINF